MKCIRCGAEVPDDARFCTECGAELTAETEAAADGEGAETEAAVVGEDAGTAQESPCPPQEESQTELVITPTAEMASERKETLAKVGEAGRAAAEKAGEAGRAAIEKAGELGKAAKEKTQEWWDEHGDEVKEQAEKIGEAGRAAADKAGELGKATAKKAGELGKAAKEKTQEWWDEHGDEVKEKASEAGEKAKQGVGNVGRGMGAVGSAIGELLGEWWRGKDGVGKICAVALILAVLTAASLFWDPHQMQEANVSGLLLGPIILAVLTVVVKYMHATGEKKLIKSLLIICVVLFILMNAGLMFIILSGNT